MAIGTSALTTIIVVTVVTAIPAFLMRKPKPVKVKVNESGEKCIDLSPDFFWLTYPTASLFLILGVYVFLFTDEPWAGIGFLAMGLIFILSTAALHALDTSVNWTSEYINGARSGGSVKKNKLFWDDVVSAKSLTNETFQLQDKLGKSVHWSVYQTGWYEIIEDLRRIRPDIDTSDFD